MTSQSVSARQLIGLLMTLLVRLNDMALSEEDRKQAYGDLTHLVLVIKSTYPELESDVQALFRANMSLVAKANQMPNRSMS
jgi:hypothetical protein